MSLDSFSFVQNDINGMYSQYADLITSWFRPGTWLVNARTGEAYQVRDVQQGGLIRLNTPFKSTDNPLYDFWFIPPAVETRNGEYSEFQPVMSLSQKIINFSR